MSRILPLINIGRMRPLLGTQQSTFRDKIGHIGTQECTFRDTTGRLGTQQIAENTTGRKGTQHNLILVLSWCFDLNWIGSIQGWCGILIFDKYTYLASFWYLSLYKYPKYTYEGPKYTYYQNILMRRVNMRKCPKGGHLKKYFLTFQIWIVMHDSWNVIGG